MNDGGVCRAVPGFARVRSTKNLPICNLQLYIAVALETLMRFKILWDVGCSKKGFIMAIIGC